MMIRRLDAERLRARCLREQISRQAAWIQGRSYNALGHLGPPRFWCIRICSIEKVLPSKAGLPTEEENPRWLGAGERVSRANALVDPDDCLDVREWLRYAYRHLHFLDDQVDDRIWENYLEGPYSVYSSPEAQALHYLGGLPLSNGTGAGDPLGDLKFYYGTIPGADWNFVNAEGREVLTALQHRLRELGESTQIVVVR